MLRYTIIIVAAALSFSNLYCQSFTKVEFSSKERRYISFQNDIEADSNRKYFKIKFTNDSSDFGSRHYPISYKVHTKLDTLSLIKELLLFEGDTDLCVLPIKCYNPSTSQVYFGKENNYSIQVEALFIINQFYFKKPFFYSPFPIIMSTTTNSLESIKGASIELAYMAYKKWFEKIKAIGINNARRQCLTPFDGFNLEWYQQSF
jgi:hypothetical protein